MRGEDAQPASLFSYIRLEDRIPADHPLRVIRTLIDPMLVALSPRFDALHSPQGRRSIAPEKLLRAPLLQVAVLPCGPGQTMEMLARDCRPTGTGFKASMWPACVDLTSPISEGNAGRCGSRS
jgi:hypothetical protein